MDCVTAAVFFFDVATSDLCVTSLDGDPGTLDAGVPVSGVGAGTYPPPGWPVLTVLGSAAEKSAGRRPSLRRPISPTHAPPSSSSPKRARRHTLMCFTPYVTNSSIPGNGFQTTPFTIGGKPLMPCPSPTSSYDPSPNFQLSACASIDSRAAASAAALLDALLDVRAVGGPLPAPASAALDGAAVAALDARGAPDPSSSS